MCAGPEMLCHDDGDIGTTRGFEVSSVYPDISPLTLLRWTGIAKLPDLCNSTLWDLCATFQACVIARRRRPKLCNPMKYFGLRRLRYAVRSRNWICGGVASNTRTKSSVATYFITNRYASAISFGCATCLTGCLLVIASKSCAFTSSGTLQICKSPYGTLVCHWTGMVYAHLGVYSTYRHSIDSNWSKINCEPTRQCLNCSRNPDT